MTIKLPLPLSVFIIAKDEEARILSAINSVIQFVDEVIVVEFGSSDRTVEIAKAAGARVVHNEWAGYGQQKIFGESLCRNKWILNIDADEEVTKELAIEIQMMFETGHVETKCGYRIKIANTFWFEEKPKKLAYCSNQTRLYNKETAGFRNSSVHDCVIIDGVKDKTIAERKFVGQLKHKISHRSFLSIFQWTEKINTYSSMQAEDAVKNGKKTPVIKVAFGMVFSFFQAYFFQRFFIYGLYGIVFSSIYAYARMMKYSKILELNDRKKSDLLY
ncbi:MAG: glycosyltransferase family 2 protein [Deltaproteobacteria bacterium]|uniref:glycosyltransferase family 2 protein n=1 Tax=Desulfobacula sp. TaxID=2593537 RepID=UPI0019BB00E0|nr:glycosyltransferase family 2 protein [Candidatus Desulfobacula maris]MBL6993968.1 glycosyltransferase family 2 protein [Desulfobacula sp.]